MCTYIDGGVNCPVWSYYHRSQFSHKNVLLSDGHYINVLIIFRKILTGAPVLTSLDYFSEARKYKLSDTPLRYHTAPKLLKPITKEISWALRLQRQRLHFVHFPSKWLIERASSGTWDDAIFKCCSVSNVSR